jgi:hypothetical protein
MAEAHRHRSVVVLPDGTDVTAVSFDAANPYGRDHRPDYGLYFDRRWRRPWSCGHLDWPDFGIPDDPSSVLSAGRPVVVDIEGLMYFDPEWEHVFLRLRFGEHYRFLRVPGLDQRRLDLYRLAMHLSLIAGPLRLLDGDYPEREPMLSIVAYNIQKALALRQDG